MKNSFSKFQQLNPKEQKKKSFHESKSTNEIHWILIR